MVDSLTFLARNLDNSEQRIELLLKTLQLFIQQGIAAKRASDSAQSSHKVCTSDYDIINNDIIISSTVGYIEFI